MKFTNRFGKDCRYKFGDKIVDEKYFPLNEIYIVHDAKWVGATNGFWDLTLQDSEGKKHSRLKMDGLKKVGSIYD